MLSLRTILGRQLVMRVRSRWIPFRPQSTIYALSSGQGKCGVSVIRVSGGHSGETLLQVIGASTLPPPRKALLRKINDPRSAEVIDKGLVLWFPGPASFTGEDVFELHVHGGIAVVDAVLNILSSFRSLRPAQPGEFTKRAFMNGKMDLTEVEGLADLIDAETSMQRRQALLQSEGALSVKYEAWKEILKECICSIEAYIEFGETDGMEDNDAFNTGVHSKVWELIQDVEAHLSLGNRGEIIREGVRVVLLGSPNIGKSSILNRLAQNEKSIVTPHAGTTRDLIEVKIDMNGYPVILTDTAGLRVDSTDEVERIGIKKARAVYEKADLVILVVDSTFYTKWQRHHTSKGIIEFIKDYSLFVGLNDLVNYNAESLERLFLKRCLVVFNKNDLLSKRAQHIFESHVPVGLCSMSCITETGFPEFVNVLSRELEELCGNPLRELPCITQARHKKHVSDCLAALENYITTVQNRSGDLVIVAEHLRTAMKCMGKLLGTVTTEDVLNHIFSRFCIGK